jgi:sarcosine oxidase subunit alpha
MHDIPADVLVIGGGPAGLRAALACAVAGAKVLIVERASALGGQLVKQTHRFFGNSDEFAGKRGFLIAQDLVQELGAKPNVQVWLDATALGRYEDGIVTVLRGGKVFEIKPKRVIVAIGAFEKFLPFENNTLPGVYGAGAVQTLMNVYGVKPADRLLMIGSGNIGLIVSYQLLQAGVDVVAVVEAMPRIGGYLVHASKIRRMGVPILTSHTILGVYGKDAVESATIAKIDAAFNVVPGSEETIKVDTVCLAVGLGPLGEFFNQAGCEMCYVPELGGFVPKRDEYNETSVKGIYAAGDAAGVEEATAAMLEGELAGISCARSLALDAKGFDERERVIKETLATLRSGPVGAKIIEGLAKVRRTA